MLDLILATLLIGLITLAINTIRIIVVKIQKKPTKDLKPIGNPLGPSPVVKVVRENDLFWKAEKYGERIWNLFISKTKDFVNPQYKLTGIPIWENLIKIKNLLLPELKNLSDEEWDKLLPPENVLKKGVIFCGYKQGYYWQIGSEMGKYSLLISKTSLFKSKEQDRFTQADSWEEIIQNRDNFFKSLTEQTP